MFYIFNFFYSTNIVTAYTQTGKANLHVFPMLFSFSGQGYPPRYLVWDEELMIHHLDIHDGTTSTSWFLDEEEEKAMHRCHVSGRRDDVL